MCKVQKIILKKPLIGITQNSLQIYRKSFLFDHQSPYFNRASGFSAALFRRAWCKNLNERQKGVFVLFSVDNIIAHVSFATVCCSKIWPYNLRILKEANLVIFKWGTDQKLLYFRQPNYSLRLLRFLDFFFSNNVDFYILRS